MNPRPAPWLLLSSLACAPIPGLAAASDPTPPDPGHSFHGEAFDQGPRQKPYLMAGMPVIRFPVTTSSPEAQRYFDQGIGQLHGFWFLEAERSFRQVHRLDTNCAMAFWGMAMANVNNEKRARGFLTNAVALRTHATPREQLYIDALAGYHQEERDGKKREARQRRRDLVRDYENLVQKFPDDIEAKAFLIYQIWDNSGFGNNTDLPITSQLAVDTLARQVLDKDPMHPVHHYRIHLWDAEKPLNAVDSAARCGQGAPGIAHMWHMPGHTFAKLDRHDDAAWQQEASARTDHAQLMRDRLLPDQIHNYTHNNSWLVESWSFLGRVHEAADLSRNLIELPRLMKTNSATASNPRAPRYDFSGSSWQRGRTDLLNLLTSFELWDELLAATTGPHLAPAGVPDDEARRALALARAWFGKGNATQATNQIASLDTALAGVREERQASVDQAETTARREKKPQADITKAMNEALASFNPRVERIEQARAEILARAALASGDTNEFRTQIELAKDLPKEQLALLQFQAGDTEKALNLAGEAARSATNEVLKLALHADLLWRAGRTNDSQKAFGELRAVRARPDLDLPVIQRLAPVAQSLGLPADWRIQHPPRADSGTRPPLDSLGPVHWQPSPAPGFQLADANGKQHSLQELRGRPVVVIFYLGRGCLHCMEQLAAFAPMTKRFSDAGLSIVAISTDSAGGLKRTLRRAAGTDEPFPFPLLADPALEAFKAWNAHDDFEDVPLHGTFLVDADGLVRWQDIGPEPFMEPAFLLEEANRLLSYRGGPKVTGTPKPGKPADKS